MLRIGPLVETTQQNARRRHIMDDLKKKSLIKMMEKMEPGQTAIFKVHETYGGDYAIIELNPGHGEKGEEKYNLFVGQTIDKARTPEPYWSLSKPKKIASWVSDRKPEFIEFKDPLKEAV